MKKDFIFVSIGLITIILLGIGFSYSLWNISVSQDTVNTVTTKCFNVEITSQKNSISLENAYPITKENGKKLTPFSFTITNTCDIFASYTVSLESLKGTTLSSKFLNAMINNEEIKKLSDYEVTDTVNDGSIESHTLVKGSLGSGDSEDYTLRVWIDYDTTMEDLDNETKTFKSKVIVKAEPSSWSPVDEGYTTLHDAILANEYQTSPEVAIKKIEAKGTPDLSKTAPIITWDQLIESNLSDVFVHKPTINSIKLNDETSNLTEDDTKITLYTTKVFDNATGNYKLLNPIHVDPTTLDFNNDTKYYYSGEYVAYNQTSKKLYSSSMNYGRSIYLVKNASKELSETTWNNTKYESYTYNLKCYKSYQNDIAHDGSDKGIYKDNDEYGKTYYYRGNINNNYVYFAGFYWQIIRINGDGSIRLLYKGKEKNATKIDTSINNKLYSFNNKIAGPTYIGYKYGYENGKTLEEIHSNSNDSDIKKTLDLWYENNIKNKNYDIYISDNSSFCGDRTLYSGSGGNGIDTIQDTRYAPYERFKNSKAIFKCPNINRDLYTLKNSNIGNKTLTYPIGLVTIDEIIFSGFTGNTTSKYAWTNSSVTYWTMSPAYSNTESLIWTVNISGFAHYRVDSTLALRPVINLKADVKISGGIGTINEPYVVE